MMSTNLGHEKSVFFFRLTVAVCFTLDVPAVMLYVSLRAKSYDAGRSTLHRIIASYRAFLGESPTTITLEYNEVG